MAFDIKYYNFLLLFTGETSKIKWLDEFLLRFEKISN